MLSELYDSFKVLRSTQTNQKTGQTISLLCCEALKEMKGMKSFNNFNPKLCLNSISNKNFINLMTLIKFTNNFYQFIQISTFEKLLVINCFTTQLKIPINSILNFY